jgi:hypothetical protein
MTVGLVEDRQDVRQLANAAGVERQQRRPRIADVVAGVASAASAIPCVVPKTWRPGSRACSASASSAAVQANQKNRTPWATPDNAGMPLRAPARPEGRTDRRRPQRDGTAAETTACAGRHWFLHADVFG